MKMAALTLGKLIVKELGLETSVDTLSRWMAHYVAQQMIDVENAGDGDDKQAMEQRCFDTILKLWKHRAYYEPGNKPFESFMPIFQTIEKMNPDNDDPFFFNPTYMNKDETELNMDDAIKQYLLLATGIDEVTRVWLEFIFQKAAMLALDEKTMQWVEAATPFADNDEVSLINNLSIEYPAGDNNSTDFKEEKKKQFEQRIEQLKKYREFNEELIALYKDELERV
jgi:hypothetical protein